MVRQLAAPWVEDPENDPDTFAAFSLRSGDDEWLSARKALRRGIRAQDRVELSDGSRGTVQQAVGQCTPWHQFAVKLDGDVELGAVVVSDVEPLGLRFVVLHSESIDDPDADDSWFVIDTDPLVDDAVSVHDSETDARRDADIRNAQVRR
jgi:hypothetical protein